MTRQTGGIARALPLDLMAAMIEAAGREVVAREADGDDLESLEHVVGLRVDDGMSSHAAAAGKLILDLGPRAAHRAVER